MGRPRPSAGLTDQTVLAKLADADHEIAARALRRHRAWRDAVAADASRQAQRSLRRAWERGRDEALALLTRPRRQPKTIPSLCWR
jgi:hypothetical protein